MLPIKHLRKRKEFLHLKNGSVFFQNSIILQTAPNNLGEVRLGYTVTKRIDKRAVYRNKIRRRIKESVRLYLKENILPSCDFVFIAKKNALTKTFQEINQDVLKAFQAFNKGA